MTWIIPFYAFALLYIKRDKLSTFGGAHHASRAVGLTLVFFSFFAYYAVVRFYPPAQFYGEANYTIFLIGLFLAFFTVRALREAIAPLVLILGATLIPFLGKGMEASLEPAIPFFVQIIAFILAMLRIPATTVDPRTFLITSVNSSSVLVGVAPACLGMYSVSTFSILIIVTLIEESSSFRTKLFWSILGIAGTFFVNIIRVSFIFVVIYYFGYENWPVIHNPLGYVLFLAWLGVFFLVFSQREKIGRRVGFLWLKTQRIRGVKGANQRTETGLC